MSSIIDLQSSFIYIYSWITELACIYVRILNIMYVRELIVALISILFYYYVKWILTMMIHVFPIIFQ